jgi:hypothetical protein
MSSVNIMSVRGRQDPLRARYKEAAKEAWIVDRGRTKSGGDTQFTLR